MGSLDILTDILVNMMVVIRLTLDWYSTDTWLNRNLSHKWCLVDTMTDTILYVYRPMYWAIHQHFTDTSLVHVHHWHFDKYISIYIYWYIVWYIVQYIDRYIIIFFLFLADAVSIWDHHISGISDFFIGCQSSNDWSINHLYWWSCSLTDSG